MHTTLSFSQRAIRTLLFLAMTLFCVVAHVIPSYAEGDFDRGRRFFALQRYEQSREALEHVVTTHPGHASAHYYLGRTYFALGEYSQAVSHGKRAVELQPEQADYHFWLGRSYGALAAHGNVMQQALLAPKVKHAFERTITLDPRHVKGRIGLAHFYMRAPRVFGGHLDKAAEQAKVLIDLQEVVTGRLLLARIYEKDKKLAATESEYQYLEQHYGTSVAHHQLYNDYGTFLLRHARYDEAIQKFTLQLVLAPDTAAAYEGLGDAYQATERLYEAAVAYHQALQLEPHRQTVQSKLQATEKALQEAGYW